MPIVIKDVVIYHEMNCIGLLGSKEYKNQPRNKKEEIEMKELLVGEIIKAFSPNDWDILKSTQDYKPKRESWSKVTPQTPRSGALDTASSQKNRVSNGRDVFSSSSSGATSSSTGSHRFLYGFFNRSRVNPLGQGGSIHFGFRGGRLGFDGWFLLLLFLIRSTIKQGG
mmetsp:Transcript_23761/g.49348  ORF Transcript_23761/g.49348 Transcript_23761/m.49348 type:complete len:168 (+) Transcript_23761:800-1303(+)